VFMGGLALGSYLLGLSIDSRENPLKIYGILEIMLGFYCLFIPSIIIRIEPIFINAYRHFQPTPYVFSLIKFFILSLLLLPPTSLMGATFPAISKSFVHSLEELGKDIGKLYSINTIGAATGSMLSGFILIPRWGMNVTNLSAAFTNLLIGISSLLLSIKISRRFTRKEGKKKQKMERRKDLGKIQIEQRSLKILLLLGIIFSGFTAMIYEVSWSRVLTLIIGSSVYAFTILLVAFLAGLSLGSWIYARFLGKKTLLTLAIVEMAIAASAYATICMIGTLPPIMIKILSFGQSLYPLGFILSFVVLLLPTTFMGIVFPFITRIYTAEFSKLGRSVGEVFSSNTLGNILGSFCAGFLLIPLLGIQKSLNLSAFINLCTGFIFLSLFPKYSLQKKGLIISLSLLCFVLISVNTPNWDRNYLTSAPYLYYQDYIKVSAQGGMPLKEALKSSVDKLLFYKEDLNATVSVKKLKSGVISMQVNGKNDASSGEDMRTQILLAHIPIMLHPDPKKILIIGLGSGVTLGSARLYEPEELDCVEISPSVVEASKFFGELNHHVLDYPKLNIVIDDARSFLTLNEKRYDIISSEPSNLWMAGVANLFTKEYFELCKRRLKPYGIMCQWIHSYALSEKDFKIALATFSSAFPHVQLWESFLGADYLLIGSNEKIKIDYSKVKRYFNNEKIRKDLLRIYISTPLALLSNYVMGREGLEKIAHDVPLNTDDHPILEFSTPKNMYLKTSNDLMESMLQLRKPSLENWVIEEKERQQVAEEFSRIISAKNHFMKGKILYNEGKSTEALKEFERSFSLYRQDIYLKRIIKEIHMVNGRKLLSRKSYAKAIEELEKALSFDPEDSAIKELLSQAHFFRALEYSKKNQLQNAVREYEEIVGLGFMEVPVLNNLGILYQKIGKEDRAAEAYLKAIEIDPNNLETIINLATFYARRKQWMEAEKYFQKGFKIDPEDIHLLINYGIFLAQQDKIDEAIRNWEKVLQKDPYNSNALKLLSLFKDKE